MLWRRRKGAKQLQDAKAVGEEDCGVVQVNVYISRRCTGQTVTLQKTLLSGMMSRSTSAEVKKGGVGGFWVVDLG